MSSKKQLKNMKKLRKMQQKQRAMCPSNTSGANTLRNRKKRQRKAAAKRRGGSSMAARGSGVVRGKGGYFGDLGRQIGSDFGRWGGGMLGGGIDTVFGLGSYNVHRNSLLRNGSVVYSPGGPPRVINTKKGEATIVNHREYIGDMVSGALVGGSTAFTLNTFEINPGNSALFPWLSRIAADFQEYELQGCLVEMISEASDFAPGVALGNVMMAAEYNPLAVAPANKIQLLELEYSATTKTPNNLIMPIECARQNDSETHLFIALDSNFLGGDARTFNLGTIFCGSQGLTTAGVKISEMWVTYEVALYKPQLPLRAPGGGVGAHFQLAGIASNVPFGGAGPVPQAGSDPGIMVNTATDTITFPDGKGSWLVTYRAVWIAIAPALACTFIAGGNLAFGPNQWATGAGNDLVNGTLDYNGGVATATTIHQTFIVNTTSGNVVPNTLTFVGGILPVVPVFGDLYITSVPFALVT